MRRKVFELTLIISMIAMTVCGPVAVYLAYKDMDRWCKKEKRDDRFLRDSMYARILRNAA